MRGSTVKAAAYRMRHHVLDMGEAINIHELAQNLIALSGLGSQDGIRIVETGLRPGEKLKEQYLAETEPTRQGPHPQILIAQPELPADFAADRMLAELRELAGACRRDAIRERLRELIPDHESDD